jgi:hypothetical protein
MRFMARASLVGAVATLALLAVSVGSGAETAARIVDRTVVCQMPGEGFPDSTRFMSVSASPRHQRTNSPPAMGASNGPSFELRVSVTTGPSGRQATGSVVLNREQCATTRLRVPFSIRGLRGGPTTRFVDASYRCDVPAKVLIRVRADFKRPTGFSRDPRFAASLIFAKGQIATAYLSIATLPGRKPLAFASVNDTTGKARLFVASRCRAEP